MRKKKHPSTSSLKNSCFIKNPVLSIRHCAHDFVLAFMEARQPSFLRSSASKKSYVVHHYFLGVIFFGVAVVNAYGDKEDHVDDSTTEVC